MRKKILLATSSVTPNAGIPSFNRELCSLLGEDYEMHLLVDENIQSYTGYRKVFSTGVIKDRKITFCKTIFG